MSSHEELVQLAELAAIGALDPEDRARLDAHLAEGCSECEAALRTAAEVGDALADGVVPMEISSEAKQGLMDRVRADATGASSSAPIRWQSYALAATVLVGLVLGGRLLQLTEELEQERLENRQVLVQLEREEIDRLRMEQELASLRGTVSALTASTTRPVPLAGQGPAPDASARAYVDPESRRLILYVYDLAEAPPDKSYQLWVIADGQPVSAGVLALGPDGGARHDTVAEATLEAGVTIAVTLEPSGGRDQPTGPIVLAGN